MVDETKVLHELIRILKRLSPTFKKKKTKKKHVPVSSQFCDSHYFRLVIRLGQPNWQHSQFVHNYKLGLQLVIVNG
jgi:hypothetical protein